MTQNLSRWSLTLLACALALTPAAAQRPPARAEYLRVALLQQGDPNRGSQVFADERRLGCTRCHTIDGQGGKAGPDLAAVGDKFGRREIIEAILTPSATIAVGYSTTTITTRAGEEFSGVVKDATDAYVELVGVDAQRKRIATRDIADRRTSEISLMPEDLQAGLSPAEFTDLVEYLVSRKVPASADLTAHGMPATIPALARPIALRPFLAESNRFAHPIWFGPVPGSTNAFFVVEHETGIIWRLEKGPTGERKTRFAELGVYTKGTRGLIGMVTHPRFQENRKYYSAQHGVEAGHFATTIWEREAAAEGTHDSGQPARRILKLDAVTDVHYGGGLAFGPDGYLYIGMGDTGPQEDPRGNGQNLGLPLGKMLRIDVDHPEADRAYRIPQDNPFVGQPGVRPEIWAYGFREPWRFSFDPLTQDLWVGDVGQDRYEEVDIVRRGENFGWNVYEGFERFSNRYRREGVSYVPPVFAYNRRYGPSVTGGFVYRGDPSSTFYGVYIFGDYQSKRVFGLTQENRLLQQVRQLGTAPETFAAFGTDETGGLYLVGYEGMIYTLDFTGTRFE